jgi:hypothetical protein
MLQGYGEEKQVQHPIGYPFEVTRVEVMRKAYHKCNPRAAVDWTGGQPPVIFMKFEAGSRISACSLADVCLIEIYLFQVPLLIVLRNASFADQSNHGQAVEE